MEWSGSLAQTVYERLYAHFGPRYWWPAVGTPEPTPAEPFEMIVGAILVQNVSWTNTEKALLNLKAAGLLSVEAIRVTEADHLAPLLRPSGYFRQKAAKLKSFVDHLDQKHGGSLKRLLDQPLAKLRPELLGLKGIGPETADCILCYAAGLPVMPMDAYTRRIFYRLGAWPESITYEAMQDRFHAALRGATSCGAKIAMSSEVAPRPPDTTLFNEYHAQLDTLGAQLCLKRAPRCRDCPLRDLCERRGVEGGDQ